MHLRLLFLSFILFSIASCSIAQSGGKTMAVNDFAKAIEKPGALLVDVRTPDEFNEKHIPHALNIDWTDDNFDEEAAKLDKNAAVYIYCKSGNRSAKAASRMRETGFGQVYELKGGITAWEQANKELVRQDDTE